MSTVNIVLMVILSAFIGFAIGNAWGKETMKRTLSNFITQITEGLKTAAGSKQNDADKKE